ncbi:MAG: sigma-54-dependent Fis family transcriptional regulator [Spirochaetales bacterium]|uniref:Sigma-54-dependent Fis family transcriptional regulator n=1 Tax=Candidatus Thalassospirochaeta sargassi TaxID=3119039 RepID=A0AAJ1IGR4_9SPIO|nr:sigma-54-dependent Fis family transcriptional regulator [Spirochaetales bacterium]
MGIETLELWHAYAINREKIDQEKIRNLIRESWERSRSLKVDPLFNGVSMVHKNELNRRIQNRKDMLEAAMPHLHKLYRIIRNSRTTITITDEDGVVLDSFYNDELKKMKNFPIPGSIHSEENCGTNGVGTALVTGKPVQIIGAEHWLKDNHNWFCNTVPIRQYNRIIGVLNLSCPINIGHEHSLGMVSSTAYAIEREMEMKKVLKERKNLVLQQRTILDLLDTGIIVINKEGLIIQNNEKAQQILSNRGDWTGLKLSEIMDCNHDFNDTFAKRQEFENYEIPVKIKGRHTYIGFSSAFIENGDSTDGMVLRLREPASIRHFAAIAGGSNAIYSFSDIIGESREVSDVLKLAELAARNTTNVLITGESGTGKELIAQSIHNSSERKHKPFVAINCGALSRELIQSELFGYEGGAFTGAKKNGNPGKFELADGGTLFLDEIGEMPLDAQTNLLRVLQTGNVLRIGARHPNRVDVRIIAATNKNLDDEIKLKNFRNDLYYRLNVLQIVLPPLRERKSDILLLATHFLKRFSKESGKYIDGFSSGAIDVINSYTWPGNIRELENTIERAVIICENELIETSALPPKIISNLPDTAHAGTVPAEMGFGNSRSNGINEVELDYIKNLLSKHRGNLRSAAAEMGVARSTLYNKLRKYKISVEDYR